MAAEKLKPQDVGVSAVFDELDSFCVAGKKRVAEAGPTRDLTDEELKTLNRSYSDGLEKMKSHRWSSKSSGSKTPYWLQGVKRNLG